MMQSYWLSYCTLTALANGLLQNGDIFLFLRSLWGIFEILVDNSIPEKKLKEGNSPSTSKLLNERVRVSNDNQFNLVLLKREI